MITLDNILGSLRSCLIDCQHDFDVFVQGYRPVMEWLVANNTGDHMGPASYHNTRHLIGVAFLTCALTMDHQPSVFAAFIHDYQYVNQTPDKVNIAHSVLNAGDDGYFELDMVSRVPYKDIVDAVRATEYDFANPMPEVEDLYHQWLRDADQLYATVFFDTVVYQGLEAEVGPKINVSGAEFLKRNAHYVTQDRLYTNTAKDIQAEYIVPCLLRHVECSTLYVN